MKHPTLQPVDRDATRRAGPRLPSDGDRRRWLRRLGNNLVERKLDAATQGLVRQEKYTSALLVSFRIARDLEEPLRDLERHIALLDRLSEHDPEVRAVTASLRRDRDVILIALQRLGEIDPPAGAAA